MITTCPAITQIDNRRKRLDDAKMLIQINRLSVANAKNTSAFVNVCPFNNNMQTHPNNTASSDTAMRPRGLGAWTIGWSGAIVGD